MRMDELDFELPERLIAQVPSARRDGARLLRLDRATGALAHHTIGDLPAFVAPGDLVVVNDTRVLPARLHAHRATGGRVDFLLLAPEGDGAWETLVRCGGHLRAGEVVRLADGQGIRMLLNRGEGQWLVQGEQADLRLLMHDEGRMPLPPYIHRAAEDERDAMDRERYQTVFAREDGAVAAPTAGLHLTTDLLRALEGRGAAHASVTLHVGLGTFAPVRSTTLEAHPMHAEAYEISEASAQAVRATRASGGRILAVGTTTVRALEAAAKASPDGLPQPGRAITDLLIAPGFPFHVVDGLLTNFHLPRSTLLALVGAFVGLDRLLAAYRAAIADDYRFFSYGDAMLIQ